MSFVPKTQPFSGKINAVTLGTGDKAIVIGGQNVLPFYTFDAPIENAPKIGVEISDAANSWNTPALREFYADCTTMADYAKKAETMEGADFLCLHFESADPNGANRSTEDCVADAKAVAEAVSMPIVIMGCKNLEKDGVELSQSGSVPVVGGIGDLDTDLGCMLDGSIKGVKRQHILTADDNCLITGAQSHGIDLAAEGLRLRYERHSFYPP